MSLEGGMLAEALRGGSGLMDALFTILVAVVAAVVGAAASEAFGGFGALLKRRLFPGWTVGDGLGVKEEHTENLLPDVQKEVLVMAVSARESFVSIDRESSGDDCVFVGRKNDKVHVPSARAQDVSALERRGYLRELKDGVGHRRGGKSTGFYVVMERGLEAGDRLRAGRKVGKE